MWPGKKRPGSFGAQSETGNLITCFPPGVVKIGLPENIKTLLRIGPATLVGGSLRDHVLGRPCNDYDIVVPKNARAFAEQAARRLDGKAFALGKGNRVNYRVVFARQTLDVTDMAGSSIREDLLGRDFTVNAMAYDLASETLVDPFGGLQDLRSKTIRLVSERAVEADPVRMIRAFRLAGTLGFCLAPETLAVITREHGRVLQSAAERVCDELFKILGVHNAARLVGQMAEAGLLGALIPELEACRGCTQNAFHGRDVFDHALETLRALECISYDPAALWPAFEHHMSSYLRQEQQIVLLKWVALLHDIGKPACRSVDAQGRLRFLGHERRGAAMAQSICTRLRMANRHTGRIAWMVENHLRPLHLFNAYACGNLTTRGVLRFVRRSRERIAGLLIHAVADQHAKSGDSLRPDAPIVGFCGLLLKAYLEDLQPKMAAPRLITGHELMQRFGLKPSRLVGTLLDHVEEGRLSGAIHTKQEAFRLAGAFLDARKKQS